ncbi:MAG: hypothetical protein HWE27_16310 [Gammaproteobacteria bacterium]|nr:hypothetical protein [Gammaproteobacteria bacterium]
MKNIFLIYILIFGVFKSSAQTPVGDYLPILESNVRALNIQNIYPHRQIPFRLAAKGTGEGQEKKSNVYFVQPIFQFETDKDSIDYPWAEHKGKNGGLILEFKLVLHTAQQRKLALEHIQRELKLSDEPKPDIDLRFWPTQRVKIDFFDKHNESELVFSAETKNEINSGDKESTVSIMSETLIPSKYEKIKMLFDKERLRASISYQYRGVLQTSAVVMAQFDSEKFDSLKKELDALVKNTTVDGKQYIFGETQRKIESKVSNFMSAMINTNDLKLVSKLPSLGSAFFNKLPRQVPKNFDISDKNDPLVKAFANYLKPLIEKNKIEYTDETKTKIKITASKTPAASFEKQHNVKLKKTKEMDTYIPVEIDYASFDDISSTIEENLQLSIKLAVAELNSFVHADTIDIHKSLTDHKPDTSVTRVLYDVPLGTVLCSMSTKAEPPVGFAWMNSDNAKWPDSSWAPKSNGGIIPDMSGRTLLGTSDRNKTGVIESGTKLELVFDGKYAPPSLDVFAVTLKRVDVTYHIDQVSNSTEEVTTNNYLMASHFSAAIVDAKEKIETENFKIPATDIGSVPEARVADYVSIHKPRIKYKNSGVNQTINPSSSFCRYMVRVY